ncbi:MAG: hypothetical protein L0Z53_09225 [Acidobacteriales bacterium]|nr:hypothetical protein [Terriglobales bacterium]
MKLYNKTRIPDDVLEPLLTAAGRAVGARTAGVVVKVTQARSRRICGLAQNHTTVYLWHLSNRYRSIGTHRHISTDGGWFRLTIPYVGCRWEPLALAEDVFKVAAHEWAHIRDYQAGGWRTLPWSTRGASGRRPIHDRRPEELRAINAVDNAIDRGALRRYADQIIALGIAYEQAAL